MFNVGDTASVKASWASTFRFFKVVAVTKTTVTLDNGKKFVISTGSPYGHKYSSITVYPFQKAHLEVNRQVDEAKQFREMKQELEDTLRNKGVSFDKLKKIMEIIKE